MKTISTCETLPAENGRGVSTLLAGIRLGTAQTHRHITVWPMFLPEEIGPNYRTLDEGIHGGHVKITEVSEGGSVPRLKVVNTMTEPLLIVDGEELIGAKQNRVVNTTLLLRENSETVIPVSCTERGRWSYNSKVFSPGDVLMEMK